MMEFNLFVRPILLAARASSPGFAGVAQPGQTSQKGQSAGLITYLECGRSGGRGFDNPMLASKFPSPALSTAPENIHPAILAADVGHVTHLQE